ncbi:MAG: S-adenosyl-L-methionine-dependent methyltransferase [Monoraphidium minutum]|nr:MAG: S-adenosyl-L-methionine-dependent methyltransferase [Monoraphidium minutum]
MAGAQKRADISPKGQDLDAEERFEAICNDGGGGKRASLFVRTWRLLMRPLLSALLRLAMKSSVSTAQSLLLMRTYFSEYGLPHANTDTVAPLLRDRMLPQEAALIGGGLKGKVRGHLMIAPVLGVPGIGRFVDVRTAWLDGRVAAGLDGGATQVVVIAAGYDTRAYRLHRPGVRFFEIDLPHSSKSKQELIAACLPDASRHPRPAYIAADLSQVSLADALRGSGFDAAQRTVFLAEGLIYYLPPQAVRVLFESVAALAAPRSTFCIDWLRLSVLSGAAFNPGYETLSVAVSNRGEPFKSGLDDASPSALDDLAALFGFRCSFKATAKELATALYGPAVPWRDFPATAATCYAFAEFERLGGGGGAP